jgi:hypothetical protein
MLGLHRRDGPLVGILLLAYWDNKEQDGVVLDSMKLMLGRIEDEASLLTPSTSSSTTLDTAETTSTAAVPS